MPRSASPAVPPRNLPPSTPRSRAQPTRMRLQQPTPGIINLPQSKSSDMSSSSPASSPNRSRHSQAGSSPHSRPDKPLPTEEDPVAKDAESKRRRRGKQNRSDSPLKQSAAVLEPVLGMGGDEAVNSTDSPSKSRRRRGGRANRQASPPLPGADAGAEQPFPSTTPPQSDYDAFSSLHSRSVPPNSSLMHHSHPRSRFPDAQSSGDEWEVPAVPIKPRENLSWQQELLRSGSTSSSSQNVRAKGHESPQSRPRSRVNGKDARTTGSAGSATSNGAKSRPPLLTSVSDNGTATGSSLNWQQELLLHTSDLSALHQPSPVKPVSNLTPARQRRHQQRDNITFGLGDLDLDDGSEELDDIFASPGRNSAGGGGRNAPHLSQAASRNRTNPSSAAATGFSTPMKPIQPSAAAVVVEPRYAGPTFHNSPAPSSLPVPSFMLRRKVEGVTA
ncbi:hypothetical protein JCM11251_002983 [Rhodosporidiobolus azoricus]